MGAEEMIFTGLEQLIGGASPEYLPVLAGRLAEAEARLHLRLRAEPADSHEALTHESNPDRLLTIQEVATFLGVPVAYAYTLARQRKIPTVRLPGLDKGGRTREGKYVRVQFSGLLAWLQEHEDRGFAKAGVMGLDRAKQCA